MLAVSGIDHTIKIFSPDNRAQYDARWGRNLNVDPARNSVHSSLSPGLRRRRPPRPDPGGDSTDRQGAIPPSLDSDDNEGAVEDGDPEILRDGGLCRRGIGLPSRRRMHDSYQIISQNDIDRAGGQNERFITVSGPSFPLRHVPMSFTEWIAMITESERAITTGGA